MFAIFVLHGTKEAFRRLSIVPGERDGPLSPLGASHCQLWNVLDRSLAVLGFSSIRGLAWGRSCTWNHL